MRHFWRTLVCAHTVAARLRAVGCGRAGAESVGDPRDQKVVGQDTAQNLSTPWSEKQDALREAALSQKLEGVPSAQGSVVNVAKVGKKASTSSSRARAPTGCSWSSWSSATPGTRRLRPALMRPSPADCRRRTFDGPLHNNIPAPNRAIDNTTLWQADYNRAHYEDMYFNRMADVLPDAVLGPLLVRRRGHDWVKVPFNEARYGRNFCGGIVCNNTWILIRDAMAYLGRGPARLRQDDRGGPDYLKTFDIAGPLRLRRRRQLQRARRLHRSLPDRPRRRRRGRRRPASGRRRDLVAPLVRAASSGGGPDGFPGVNAGSGGVVGRLPTVPNNPTGIWVGDYTIQPENGGLGVFAHEYAPRPRPAGSLRHPATPAARELDRLLDAHVLRLQHRRRRPTASATHPGDLGAWDKLQLGWLDYDERGRSKTSHAPSSARAGNNSSTSGAGAVVEPAATSRSPELGGPYDGLEVLLLDAGDNLDNLMTKPVTSRRRRRSPRRCGTRSKRTGTTPTSMSDNGGRPGRRCRRTCRRRPGSERPELTAPGSRAPRGGNWVDLGDPAGRHDPLGFRYSPTGRRRAGFRSTTIAVGGRPIDGAEADVPALDVGGFRITTGSEESFHENYYIAENRQYLEYDARCGRPTTSASSTRCRTGSSTSRTRTAS